MWPLKEMSGFDTEGSNLIKEAILDNDERTLYIQSWGGFNTVGRALISIAEEYKDKTEWTEIYNKVCDKVILTAHSQDNSWKDYILEFYPDLTTYQAAGNGYGYFATQSASEQARYHFSR